MKNSRNPPSLFVNVVVVKITDNNTFISYLGIIYKINALPFTLHCCGLNLSHRVDIRPKKY